MSLSASAHRGTQHVGQAGSTSPTPYVVTKGGACLDCPALASPRVLIGLLHASRAPQPHALWQAYYAPQRWLGLWMHPTVMSSPTAAARGWRQYRKLTQLDADEAVPARKYHAGRCTGLALLVLFYKICTVNVRAPRLFGCQARGARGRWGSLSSSGLGVDNDLNQHTKHSHQIARDLMQPTKIRLYGSLCSWWCKRASQYIDHSHDKPDRRP